MQPKDPRLNVSATDPVLSVAYHDDSRRIGETLSLAQVTAGEPLMLGWKTDGFDTGPLARESCIGREQMEIQPWQPAGMLAVKAIHETVATEINGEPLNGVRILNPGDRIAAGRLLLVYHLRNQQATKTVQENSALSGISIAICDLRERIAKLAPQNTPCLLSGEAGVGKEVAAREIHRLSGRPGKMASLNCRALPESLGEGYLLGWAAGAFEGANTDRPSLFETADNGTLFLDALDEMTAGLQETLLNVLQTGKYTRLGDSNEKITNVRLVATTVGGLGRLNTALRDLLTQEQLTIPPLRDRPEDVPLLAYHLLHRNARELSMKAPIIGFGLMQSLLAATWPLNARALRKALKSLLVVQPDQARLAVHPVLREALGAALTSINTTQEVTLPPRPTPARFITDTELREVAEATNYDGEEVARRLRCDSRSIIRRLKRLASEHPGGNRE